MLRRARGSPAKEVGAMMPLVVLGSLLSALAFVFFVLGARTLRSARAERERLLEEARREAEARKKEILVEAKEQALEVRRQVERDLEGKRRELLRREERVSRLEEEAALRLNRLERREREIQSKEEGAEERLRKAEEELSRARRELERLAGLSAAEAKKIVMKEVEAEARREALSLVRQVELEAREEAEKRARKILAVAIQRVASDMTSETTVSVVPIPSDDMKGRIIGREGRNIRAFEAVTGVNLIIDDTPEAVLLSSFDPVRREVARLTLERLVADGRIHPARIEEAYERARAEVEAEIVRAGEDAVAQTGVGELNPQVVKALGRLRFRTSYGQNVLKHLVESAHIAGIIAHELGMKDARLVKRATLLHDIGKALTHEVEGPHAAIGAEFLRRFGESPDVVHAVAAHHGEVEPKTVEAVLVQVADAISGGRPGARRESIEQYVRRLERLEEIAQSMPGVERCFAMQAGREIRVMVKPEEVDDLSAYAIARDIAKKVESELQYPGQIKVTVVREVRAVEYAK